MTVRYFFDAIDVEYAGEVCVREIDQKGAILSHPTVLEECRQAGMAFVADGLCPDATDLWKPVY